MEDNHQCERYGISFAAAMENNMDCVALGCNADGYTVINGGHTLRVAMAWMAYGNRTDGYCVPAAWVFRDRHERTQYLCGSCRCVQPTVRCDYISYMAISMGSTMLGIDSTFCNTKAMGIQCDYRDKE